MTGTPGPRVALRDAVPIAGLVMGSAAMVKVSRVAVLLTFSSLLSFISIRATNQTLAHRCETIADYLFIASLLGLLLVIVVITLTFV